MANARCRGRAAAGFSHGGLAMARPAVLAASRIILMGLTASAAPIRALDQLHDGNESRGANVWVLYVASIVLVLLGGAFAGLTIALMGQDSIYLQVLARDPTEPQRKNARRVYDLLERGKHWVLVTLLLSNVIVNETLPVVLDRCLGGGVAAVIGSTVLIVIFGEVVPQSVCVRYGLPIGGYMSKPVLLLMYIMAPVAWPTAKLLDWALGEDHGTVYKKSGLKTLVTLHRNLGEVSERLNQDEVTIIGAVLDLKEKPVQAVMTPMEDVFVMSEDTVLDERTMDIILSAGYSRIPIHETGNPTNFIGMLLVKILITYDPEDARLVKDFALATLPETRPETSCLDIINFFQEGKSHMVLVSEFPGEDHGALGVVTLEDVIEELIGEEIIDESDVYIDIHKAIRRLAPAPKARLHRRLSGAESGRISSMSGDIKGAKPGDAGGQDVPYSRLGAMSGAADSGDLSSSPKPPMVLLRRTSANADGRGLEPVLPIRRNLEDVMPHLKHLGPSNPATNPKSTRSTTVKIKPGIVLTNGQERVMPSMQHAIQERLDDIDEDERTGLLPSKLTPKDGARAVQQSYGSMLPSETHGSPTPEAHSDATPIPDQHDHGTQTQIQTSAVASNLDPETSPGGAHTSSTESVSTSRSEHSTPRPPRIGFVRSGSITENIIESRGIRKVVLETTSSNDDEEGGSTTAEHGSHTHLALVPVESDAGSHDEEAEGEGSAARPSNDGDQSHAGSNGGKKKNRRKKRKGGKQ
ncbi:DUF21 and CBS domain-containing protein [Pleurostoma richardsiae]|uniref:DUF21 and CBS domain-containing protein n=1 Tax=Pleurostoma richardsiae TaxID=41990 RepID=A0AA38RIJ7_9PEZI|nr:DUF21 and CBS domain-containing protein [Pleurostoma richardsiae]